MRKPWYKQRPRLLDQIRDALSSRYPDLRVVEDNETVFVRGTLPIEHEGRVLDRYQIEIGFPSDYPRSPIPAVRETQGRIPRHLDRHVLSCGNACLFIEEEWLLEVGEDPSFLEFLDGPVRNFFISQSLVEAGESWPFGDREHGLDGLLDVYSEWFETRDEFAISQYFDYLTRRAVKGHWPCPCGSGKKLRHCHVQQVRDLRERIPRSIARRALTRWEHVQKIRRNAATLAAAKR